METCVKIQLVLFYCFSDMLCLIKNFPNCLRDQKKKRVYEIMTTIIIFYFFATRGFFLFPFSFIKKTGNNTQTHNWRVSLLNKIKNNRERFKGALDRHITSVFAITPLSTIKVFFLFEFIYFFIHTTTDCTYSFLNSQLHSTFWSLLMSIHGRFLYLIDL